MTAEKMADHLKDRGAEAAIVVDGDGAPAVEALIAAGWTTAAETEFVYGKRVRYLKAPERTA